MSEQTSQPYFSVDFGEAGGTISWNSREDVIAWIDMQIADWQWLSLPETTNAAQNAVNWMNQNFLHPAKNNLSQISQYSDNPEQIKNLLNAAKNFLQNFYSNNSWLLPNSAYRKFIFEIRDNGKTQEAGLITAHLLKQDLNNSPLHKVIPALLDLELFNRGSKDRVKAEGVALKNLVGQMTTALTEHKELQISQTNAFSRLNEDLSKQATDRAIEFDESQGKRDEQWAAQLGKTESELKNLTATYDAHMTLAAPVEYWEKKRRKHRNSAIASLVFLILGMLLFGCELVAQVSGKASYLGIGNTTSHPSANVSINKTDSYVPKDEASRTPSTNGNKATQSVTVSSSSTLDYFVQSKIGAYILLVTLIFWFIRLLVRLFLSNIHLENDAAERVTMAKTFLALIRDGSFERKENMGTILAALFRPTGDGIVKDEGLPPTAMEWLTKLSGKN